MFAHWTRSAVDVDPRAFLRSYAMRKITTLAIATATLLIAACNTVEGVGKDVRSAGDTVAKTADGAK